MFQLSRGAALGCLVRWLRLLRMLSLLLLSFRDPQVPLNCLEPSLTETSRTNYSGVAVGSSIGHAIGGLFGGGSSNAPAAETQQNSIAAQGNETAYGNNSWGARSCEVDAKQFTKCLDENGGNMQICGWYLEQLVSCSREKIWDCTGQISQRKLTNNSQKACQQAASQY